MTIKNIRRNNDGTYTPYTFSVEIKVLGFLQTVSAPRCTAMRIARAIEMSDTRVRRALQRLVEAGLVRGSFNHRPYRYEVASADEVSAAVESNDDSMEFDAIDDGPVEHPTYKTLQSLLECGATRIWITGEAGLGKTYAATTIAKTLGLPLFIITPVEDKYELFGSTDGNGVYHETELYRWATHDGPAVLLMDEIDGNDPGALIAMNAVLANGVAVFPIGQVEISDDKVVIATANTTGDGATMRYSARQAQDFALIDRFEYFPHWGLHQPTEMKIAQLKHPDTQTAVRASWKIRENLERFGVDTHWGPRRTYAICKAVAGGKFSVREAAMLGGLSRLPEFDSNHALEGVN